MMHQNKIVIVSNKKVENRKIAYLLMNMIEAIGKYQAVVWEEKHYKDNEPTMLSSQYVILIGKNRISKLIVDSIQWEYEYLNMRYGWIGKKAVINVERKLLKQEEYLEFQNQYTAELDKSWENTLYDDVTELFYKIDSIVTDGKKSASTVADKILGEDSKINNFIRKTAENRTAKQFGSGVSSVLKLSLFFPFPVIENCIKNGIDSQDIFKQQYLYLVSKFIMESLDDFMGTNILTDQ